MDDENAPVLVAADRGDVGVLRRLLEEDPGCVHESEEGDGYFSGWTPLHYASKGGHVQALRLLLDHAADIDALSLEGQTPLMQACNRGRVEAATLLLARGADPTIRDVEGRQALAYAAGWGCFEVLRVLLKDGRCQVNDYGIHEMTALWYACCWGHEEVARVLLLEGGADHTLVEKTGSSPLEIAKLNKRSKCVALLQWFEGELERALYLAKARALVDSVEVMRATSADAAQKARGEVVPAYLRARVEGGEALPRVEVAEMPRRSKRRGKQAEEGETRRAVVQHVVDGLKGDVFFTLLDMMKLR